MKCISICLAAALLVGCAATEEDLSGNCEGCDLESQGQLASTWDLIIERASFSPTYKGQQWDGDRLPDPFVKVTLLSDSDGYRITPSQIDTTTPEFGDRLLAGIESLEMTSEGISFTLLDQDSMAIHQVRGDPAEAGWVQDPDFPDDDYIVGIGMLVHPSYFDGAEHVVEMSYEGVEAELVIRLEPAEQGCGEVAAEASCSGNVVVSCQQGAVVELDCGDYADCGWDADLERIRCL